MKITKIEKKKRLYQVDLDGADSLYVTEDTIVHFMLSKQMVISEEELADIKQFAQLSYGKNLALYHISFKPRTAKEVRDYLQKHEIDDKLIPEIIKQLKDDKWIDESRLVELTIEQNLSSGDKGAFVLKQKLMQRGISSSIIEPIMEQYDFTDLGQKLAQKLYKKYQTKLPNRALKDKIIQFLNNKGFDYQLSKLAVETLAIERDDELEEELIYKELDKQYRKYSRKYEGYDLKQRLIQALMRKGFGFDDIKSALREYL